MAIVVSTGCVPVPRRSAATWNGTIGCCAIASEDRLKPRRAPAISQAGFPLACRPAFHPALTVRAGFNAVGDNGQHATARHAASRADALQSGAQHPGGALQL